MTFLSVYTPTYKRPRMLGLCCESVASQTRPVEHVIVPDLEGLGVAGMFADIPNHAHRVTGDYVMVLSDDNVLADNQFSLGLEAEAAANDYPDVIVFKGDILGTIQPVSWGGEPVETKIDLSCFAVKREIWQRHAADWGHRYCGDFDFIHKLWENQYRFHWWDRVGFRALKISRGVPE